MAPERENKWNKNKIKGKKLLRKKKFKLRNIKQFFYYMGPPTKINIKNNVPLVEIDVNTYFFVCDFLVFI